MTIEESIKNIRPLDGEAVRAAQERQDGLLKPRGSLGELEALSVCIAGITGQVKNTLSRKVHFLFGSDHGICEEGVSGSPQYFTRVLMELYSGDGRCGINVLCRRAGADLRLYDLGVKGLSPRPGIDSSHKLMPQGTANFAKTCAMPPETARAAVELGIQLVEEVKDEGYQVIGAGEVGMGNTAPAAACIMAALDRPDPELVGRGGGLTDVAFANKKRVIVEALKLHHPSPDAPLEILSCVGGLDIAAMTGVFLGAAACRLPVIIDGAISIAAALLASRLAAAEAMGLIPLFTLGMRLGEGTGCPLAMQLVDDALAVMNEMGSFSEVSLESGYREKLKA